MSRSILYHTMSQTFGSLFENTNVPQSCLGDQVISLHSDVPVLPHAPHRHFLLPYALRSCTYLAVESPPCSSRPAAFESCNKRRVEERASARSICEALAAVTSSCLFDAEDTGDDREPEENLTTFLSTPFYLEPTMLFGCILCIERLLDVAVLLPIRTALGMVWCMILTATR